MYPIPPTETLVETKTCRHCSVSFPITDKDLEFYEKVSPVFPLNRHSELVSESSAFPNNKEDPGSSPGWRNVKIEWDKIRYLIPTPTLCPDCRQQRRLSFRNERKLYKRKCDATGRDIISIYSPDKPFKVYHQDFWWSDKWDPAEYGRDFDFNKTFAEQIRDLWRQVPRMSLLNGSNENTEYANLTADNKNCYLIFESSNNEDCYHGYWLQKCEKCLDTAFSHECRESYEIQGCYNCFGSKYLEDCMDCGQSAYLSDCQWCRNCFGCINLTNKTYCILNKQYSKEEYEQFLQECTGENFQQFKNNLAILKNSSVKKYAQVIQLENSFGDYMKNVKNCFACFHAYDAEDCRYGEHIWRNAKDIMDASTVGRDANLVYEGVNTAISVANDLFCAVCWNSHHVICSMECFNSSYLFACVGLNNKQYCILNKQYTKEEYEALVPRIIEHMMKTGEWWEFFPSSISPFGYNETVAMEYYPLSRDVALQRLYSWSDYEPPFPKVEKIIPADKLPDDTASIPDDILNWAIECEMTKKPFRITKQELDFYRKHNLPIPRRHPDQRHLDRMALRNPEKLFERKCDKCGVEVVTVYGPERKEVVYCWACYNAEVMW